VSKNLSRRFVLAGAASISAASAAKAAKALVIDAHTHAGSGVRTRDHWHTEADPEVTLRHMAEAGIDRTIVFPLENPGYEKANQEIAELCGRYPGKFIGFARHDPVLEGDRIPDMLKREVRSLGLKGLKLSKHPTRPVLDAVAELGIPVIYHAEKVVNFNMPAEAYPQIPFIIAHMGSHNYIWGEHLAAIDLARRFRNVYLETSLVGLYKFLEMAVKEAGPGKLIFGSDGPEFDSRAELYKIKLLKLPPREEAMVLGGNIQRLLPKGSV
jgi:uncharacterized protein